MIIYKCTNLVNGFSYIGVTTKSIEYRKRTHEKASKYSNKKFYNALKKYEFDNFEWSILHECTNIDELNSLETYYIEKYDTFNNGYNLTTGGELKKIISEESKQLMRSKRLEWFKHNKNGFKGKTHTEETKKILREKRKDKPSPNKGKVLNDTHRENLKIAQINWLENNTHPFKGKKQNELSKQKMKESWKSREYLVCPHCNKSGKSNMTRYHFDNCKNKI
jgi:group I intron endonuclease